MRAKSSRFLALALVPVLAPACRSTPPAAELLSEEAVVLELPVGDPADAAGRHACGIVALEALCRYHARELESAEHDRLSWLAEERGGLSGAEIREALERKGFEVFVFPGTLDRGPAGLYRHVDLGRPLLVLLDAGGESLHYALVLGYDPPRATVCLLDPARGHVVLPVGVFESWWEGAEHFALLALPKSPGVEPETTERETEL